MSKERLVCISDFKSEFKNIKYPIKGEIYTLRGLNPVAKSYLLVEIVNPKTSITRNEPGFCPSYFRPVQNMDVEIEYIECTLLKEVEYSEALKEMQL